MQFQLACKSDPDSQTVTERVESCLQKSAYTAMGNVSYEFDQGVLLLRGRLDSYRQKQAAQDAVSGVEGVVEVVNQIQVLPQCWFSLPEVSVRSLTWPYSRGRSRRPGRFPRLFRAMFLSYRT
jgi:hypothetical protein